MSEISITQCNPNNCEHKFDGWKEFENGGSAVCVKCGMLYETWAMFNLP